MKQEHIWDYFQNEAPGSFDGSVARQAYLARNLGHTEKVLNIGVGVGILEKIALSRGIDIYSLDPIERSIESLRDRLGMGEKAKVGYSQDIPFPDAFFEGVVMSEVLEHLSDEVLNETLTEVYRVLVRGGRFVGTVPSREDLSQQVVICPCCGNRFHRWGHAQSFDPTHIRSLLSDQFQVEALSERNFVTWKTLNWKGKLSSFLKVSLRRFGIHGSSETIYFRARKRCGLP